jgi:hypothetical protein
MRDRPGPGYHHPGHPPQAVRVMAAYPYRLPRKYRYRPRGKISNRDAAIIAAIIAVAAASAGGAKTAVHHGRAGHVSTADVVIPGGSDLLTPSGWAKALLAADSLPVTTCNFAAVTEWERREGGGFGNQAAYNPLNVNPGPGAGWPGSPAIGAWAFPDAATGLRYTVATLNLGYYDSIRAALRAGDSAQAVCNAIMASPWAGSHYDGTLTATC